MRGEATQFNYTKSHSFPDVFSPYIAPFVPEPRLDTSRRLQNLIVDGKLNLTLDDAIALALENNMEIAVARYDLPNAQTDLLREKEGGATRGVAGSHQSSTLFSGLASNTPTASFNPEFVSGLSVGFNQHLLKGFGTRTNSRFIRIGRNDVKFSISIFRQNVINEVAVVMTTYYDLLSDLEMIRAAQEGLEHGQKLLKNNQAEGKSGPVAHYDVLLSQEEVALRQQDLLEAQNTFSEHAQSLKAKISKSFNEELATVEVIPSDRLPDPHSDDVPALAEALREPASHRPEIEQADLSLCNQQIAIQATRNSLLPSLDVYASYYPSGLDGALRPTFGNIFQNDFPNLSYGARLNLSIRNRTAQADAARALLEQRQLQTELQNAKDCAVWDVSKAVSAVQQARDRLDAALNW